MPRLIFQKKIDVQVLVDRPTDNRSNEPTYPYIDFWADILFSFKQFWCSIRRTSTPCLQKLSFSKVVGKSKVYTNKSILMIGNDDNRIN